MNDKNILKFLNDCFPDNDQLFKASEDGKGHVVKDCDDTFKTIDVSVDALMLIVRKAYNRGFVDGCY